MPKPTRPDELWAFIGAYFDVWLPWRSFTPGHSSPFNFVSECFFHPERDVAAWASRSGGKTLAGSILAALVFAYTDGIQARVLSGSEDQARFLYEYWSNWCYGLLRSRLNGNVTRRLTKVGGGRMEILAASSKRVRGPKVQLLLEDEVDEIDQDVADAAVGMLDTRDGMPARTRYMSTWHRVGGPMGNLVANRAKSGISLHKWNLWESITECPTDRHQNGKGCDACPLGIYCVPKAREFHADDARKVGIAAEASGFYQVADVIKAIGKLSDDKFLSEWLCERPSAEGMVYPAFDESVHVVDRVPEHLDVFAGLDWGYGVFAGLILGLARKTGIVYLLDTYKAEHATTADNAAGMKALPSWSRVKDVYCDPAGRNKNDQTGRSDIEDFAKYGIECQYTLAKRLRDVHNGIQLVRSYVKSADGRTKFFVLRSPANQAFVDDINNYLNRKVNGVYVDEPVKPQDSDHTADAWRYAFVNRLAGPQGGAVKLGAS